MKQLARGIFWSSIGMIFYVYIGFPLILALRGLLLRPQSVKRSISYKPRISVIVAAHNEATAIIQKLDNLLSTHYPSSQLEIIVASDGSDDGTNELVARYPRPKYVCLYCPGRVKTWPLIRQSLAQAKF
jgi:cellulose synthase/poly-beta-1,6-N-acetylglucosamine synthase-like glycosyltransferase